MDSSDTNLDINNANATSPPNRILGYVIRSQTHIYVSYIIPPILATFVYIVQFVADCAVSYEHFHNHRLEFGAATLSLILMPPLLTFILVLSSKPQRENQNKYSSSGWRVFGYLTLQTLLFPFAAIYRFAVRVFWSIEALFQNNNDEERMLCLQKSSECAYCELYLFIQAYAQAAPQIMLQMYHMLTQDLFRDYETTTVQAICLVFSAIDLAAVTTTYQRFESQHRVGRAYPWSSPQQIAAQRRLLECNSRLRHECACRKKNSERNLTRFPQSEVIMRNFEKHKDARNIRFSQHVVQVRSIDEVDNDEVNISETTVLIHQKGDDKPMTTTTTKTTLLNATDDDKIRTNPKLDIPSSNHDEITLLDTFPESPAPAPPPSPPPPPPPQTENGSGGGGTSLKNHRRSSKTFSQLETFKDMLLVNAQLYIKEHVPHPPKMLISSLEAHEVKENENMREVDAKSQRQFDEIDFFLQRQTKIINGIEQEDCAARTIAFFGWISYIIMRMLSLAAFCCFYPKEFFIIIAAHYAIMLIALCLESRFNGKASALLFYPILAYVFIFVLIEFRIKFKRIRLWFSAYIILTMAENIALTIIWNVKEEFESWWFGFITESIFYSACLFVATLIVYYVLLKPKDVILIVEDNLTDEK